jgi:hypothetical protein
MKWAKTKTTENEGLLRLQDVVNRHGSIFRKIHQEEDIGIDGTIEIVQNQEAQGLLLAIQVKAGDSFARKDKFVVPIKQTHLDYWQALMLPVVIVCYSPNKQLLAWESVSQYLERFSGKSLKSIEVPFRKVFDEEALNQGLRGIALVYDHERKLFKSADLVLSDDAEERRQGMLLLTAHPASKMTRLIVYLASQMILDENLEIVRLAITIFGYCITPTRWAEYYYNTNWDIPLYARRCCYRFDKRHITRLMEALSDGDFGRASLGEACLSIVSCIPNSEDHARQIVLDIDVPLQTRVNALALFYAGDWLALLYDEALLREEGLGDLVEWLKERYQLDME